MDLRRGAQPVLRAGQAQQEAQGRLGHPQGAGFVPVPDRVGQHILVLPSGRGDQVDSGAAAVVREASGVLELSEGEVGFEGGEVGAVDVERGHLVTAGREFVRR